MTTIEQSKFIILNEVLVKLESITEGETPISFGLRPHNFKKLEEYQSKKLFKKYIIEFSDNGGFRITAKTLESNLEVSLLYFEKLKQFFDKSKQIYSAISIENGDFVILYPKEE